jgi:hypothetical protein
MKRIARTCVAFADVTVTAQGKLCLTADGTSAESVFYEEVVDTLASLLRPGGARQSWCWAKSPSVSRRTGGPQNAERLEHTLGLAEGSARLCHNPVFGAFWLCKLLILLDSIFKKSTFNTVWRASCL